MNIDELKIKQGNINVEGTVIDKQEVREWNKFGKAGKVCNGILKDDTGAVSLTLWNDQCEQVNLGDKIKVTNGYCGEYNGDKQVSTGKLGKIEVLGHDDNVEDMPESKPKESPVKEEELDSIEDEDNEDVVKDPYARE